MVAETRFVGTGRRERNRGDAAVSVWRRARLYTDVKAMAILGSLVAAGCGAATERAETTPSIARVPASELVATASTWASRSERTTLSPSLLPVPATPPRLAPLASLVAETTARVPARIVPGGEIPLDLRDRPPRTPESEPVDGVPSAMGGRDVAVAWVMERYTARFDEPAAERSGRLAGLTSSPELASSEPPAPAQVAGGATWPINVTLSEGAAGEWDVTFTLNRTPADGPLVTMTTTVTVTGEVVTGEQLQP